MGSRTAVVTGGSGFIGAYLTRRLVHEGWTVRVMDTMARGEKSRLDPVINDIDLQTGDVRDIDAVRTVCKGADVVFHLAAINGTENFYNHPDLVLDVGLRGALAVVEGARDAGVPDMVVASSAEVYQTPATVPTDETVALMLPDSLNPRYSYGGSKIVSELIAFNYARDHYSKMQVFRPHNVYGPDMGFKHVLPQFLLRAFALKEQAGDDKTFEIQGDGSETRAFAYVDDVVSGIITMWEKGGHREIYHIGNDQEISITELAMLTAEAVGLQMEIKGTVASAGATPRRCPDISKMRALGYDPQVDLRTGLRKTADWYQAHRAANSENLLL